MSPRPHRFGYGPLVQVAQENIREVPRADERVEFSPEVRTAEVRSLRLYRAMRWPVLGRVIRWVVLSFVQDVRAYAFMFGVALERWAKRRMQSEKNASAYYSRMSTLRLAKAIREIFWWGPR